jgi:aspartyl-tRNA(Asn)/glutamyl-tRNA(Gln) amidotransferase subunit A
MIERDLVGLVEAIRAGETTAEVDMQGRLARIDAVNPRINAVLDVFRDDALEAACKADTRSPMAGAAVGHKNMIWRKGRRATYGSKVTEDHRPDVTAAVNRRLDAAGAIDLASIMMTEFAQGATGHNHHFGPVLNPWDTSRVTGGSSSGSAAAVASGMVLASLGSDTAGSIRLPASLCGVTGLKPTWSRVPLSGTMPLASNFDCIGPLARSARDCALMLGIVAGRDDGDALSSSRSVKDYSEALSGDLRGLRIGIPRQFFLENVDTSIQALFDRALDVLRSRGAVTVAIDMPAVDEIGTCLTLALRSEIAAQHADWLANRFADYAPQLATRMLPHASIPAVAYLTAMRRRPELLKLYADEVFDKVDVIACPTVTVSPPTVEQSDLETDVETALGWYGRIARNAGLASFLGLPALSAPMGFCDQAMPAGLQLIGRPFGEARILKIADTYQRDTDWHLRMPTGIAGDCHDH